MLVSKSLMTWEELRETMFIESALLMNKQCTTYEQINSARCHSGFGPPADYVWTPSGGFGPPSIRQ